MAEQKPFVPIRPSFNLPLKPQSLATGKGSPGNIRYEGSAPFSLDTLKAKLPFLNNFFQIKSWRQLLDIKFLNSLLMLLAVILLAYFCLSLVISVANLRKDFSVKVKTEKVAEVKGPQVRSALKATSYYLDKARARDIFSMGTKKAADSAFNKGPSQKIKEITQSLRLVGISWSDDPDVMIEDTKNQRTYFLK